MKIKDKVISDMCYTYRHDFGLLSPEHQDAIYIQMTQIFDNVFVPMCVKMLKHTTAEIFHDYKLGES